MVHCETALHPLLHVQPVVADLPLHLHGAANPLDHTRVLGNLPSGVDGVPLGATLGSLSFVISCIIIQI